MNIYQKLLNIQSQLKAPKGQFNSFAKFSYRSLEDIVESVKPLLAGQNVSLTISDTVKQIGDRFYVESTAILTNAEKPDEKIISSSLAREAEMKKGMDDSQITGAASSYARKYCLNGLFSIDDTKDADNHPHQYQPAPQPQGLSQEQLDWLAAYCQRKGYADNETKKAFMAFHDFTPKTTSPDEFSKIQRKIEAEETHNLQ
jgi:hypothetical protein